MAHNLAYSNSASSRNEDDTRKMFRITTATVVKEAKKIYPGWNIQTALKQYIQLQESILKYSTSESSIKEAVQKYSLARLIADAFEPYRVSFVKNPSGTILLCNN
ncbi:MAG TPA: hypothetical protein PK397_10250 [Ignavibacteriaceae bacterium]|jgi:exonuclease V gamma subunit|nr:hypothetical protein [Ignavibacteriaceae bacterium]